MSYQNIKVFTMQDEHVGYLSCSSDWTTMSADITKLERAYPYKWVDVDGGLRLDQQTDGGDRSLTYSSNGNYPCWGLGVNWVVVQHHEDETITTTIGGELRYLARPLFNQGPSWSANLVWTSEERIAHGVCQKLKFRSDA
jgi:hypothetical protein